MAILFQALFTDTVYSKPISEPISYITGLQTALDAKVDDSQVLTNVPANAVFTDTLYTHPSQHSIPMITGLQTALNGKQATITGVTQSSTANTFTNGINAPSLRIN